MGIMLQQSSRELSLSVLQCACRYHYLSICSLGPVREHKLQLIIVTLFVFWVGGKFTCPGVGTVWIMVIVVSDNFFLQPVRIRFKFNEQIKTACSYSTTANTKVKQNQEKAHPILQREHEPRKIASSTETQECEASFLQKLHCASKRLPPPKYCGLGCP